MKTVKAASMENVNIKYLNQLKSYLRGENKIE